MIVNAKQYEQLRHEALKAAAPRLWSLLSYPFDSNTPHRKVTAKWQREALTELRSLLGFVPDRLLLDFDDEPTPGTGEP